VDQLEGLYGRVDQLEGLYRRVDQLEGLYRRVDQLELVCDNLNHVIQDQYRLLKALQEKCIIQDERNTENEAELRRLREENAILNMVPGIKIYRKLKKK
jgi:uncharacterized membrane protein YgaE (UPF0421/DUF939 family)